MTLFIVPGFRQKISDPVWQQVKSLAENFFAKVVMFQPDWNYNTLADLVKEFDHLRQKHTGPQIVLGFSFGAMIAYLSSINLSTQATILCSLSPYFAEDIPYLRPWWNLAVGKRRIAVFQETLFSKLAAQNNGNYYLLVGEKEVTQCHARYQDALKRLMNVQGTIVPGAGHDISAQNYLDSLSDLFPTLISNG